MAELAFMYHRITIRQYIRAVPGAHRTPFPHLIPLSIHAAPLYLLV
jgi:hypothetical protein